MIVDGQSFVRMREAAKLSGVHPVALEMAQTLLKGAGNAGAAFVLGTPELVRRADDIAALFKAGLRKAAKAFDPDHKRKVKMHRDGQRLVFWYA